MTAPSGGVLVTGFEPFGGEAVNPSWQVAQALQGQVIHGWPVVAVQLPCVFARAPQVLAQALAAHQPAWVLALGLAGSRSAVSIERVAVNLIDARIADNAGDQPLDQPVLAGGPAAHFSSLPVKALWQALLRSGVPAEVSMTAGAFVCNQVFYLLMQALAQRPGVRGGFIHLPPLPEQAAQHPHSRPLALAQQVAALHTVLGVLRAPAPEGELPPAGRTD